MRPAIKYQAIFKNKDAYSISFLCTFFEVSRSGYYKWLRQKDKPDRDLTLGKLIQECQQKT
ncbi:transposase, partial [bacterium 1XD42-8]